MYVAPRDPTFRKLVKLADGDIDLVTKALAYVNRKPRHVRSLRDVIKFIEQAKSKEAA